MRESARILASETFFLFFLWMPLEADNSKKFVNSFHFLGIMKNDGYTNKR